MEEAKKYIYTAAFESQAGADQPVMIGNGEKQEWFRQNVGEPTLILLKALHSFNLLSRRYAAAAIYNALYKRLNKNDREFGTYDEQLLTAMKNVVSLDILSKCMMSIEDLGAILVAAQQPLRDFAKKIIRIPTGDALSEIKKLSNANGSTLRTILSLEDLAQYELTDGEKRVLEGYYEGNFQGIKKILKLLSRFIEKHEWAFRKFKHGLPMVLSIEQQALADGIDGLVPIFTSPEFSESKFVLTGDLVVEKYLSLIRDVTELSKDVVLRKIEFAEYQGYPPPFISDRIIENGQLKERLTSYYKMSDQERVALEGLFKRVMPKLMQKRTAIELALQLTGKRENIDEMVQFYLSDWKNL